MTTLITGGSKCRKSRFAEDFLANYRGRKIYIATMQPFGDEAKMTIQKHLRHRSGKGFETIEKYTDIHELKLPENSAVLLECVGNLCANEMFFSKEIIMPSKKIINGIRSISEQVSELVIVTNQVGSDGIRYAEGTAAYIAEMGRINSGISQFADNVIECVYGIPIVIKGELPC